MPRRRVGFENTSDPNPETQSVRHVLPPSGRLPIGYPELPYVRVIPQSEETMKVVYTMGVYSAGMSTSEASTMYVERLGQGEALGLRRIDHVEPMTVKYARTSEGQVKMIKFRVVGYEQAIHRRLPSHADYSWLLSSTDTSDEPPSGYAGRAMEEHMVFDARGWAPTRRDRTTTPDRHTALDAQRWASTYRDRVATPNQSWTLSTSSRLTAASEASTATSAGQVIEILEQARSADDEAESLHRATLTLRRPDSAQPQHEYTVPRRRCCGVDLTNVDQIFYDYLRDLGLQHDEALIAHPGIKRLERTTVTEPSDRSDETVDPNAAQERTTFNQGEAPDDFLGATTHILVDPTLPAPQHPPKSFQTPPLAKPPPPHIPLMSDNDSAAE